MNMKKNNDKPEFHIGKAFQKYDQIQLSDDRFNEMWRKAAGRKAVSTTIPLRLYLVAATVALFLALAGSVISIRTTAKMQTQYAAGQEALHQVAYYMGLAMNKLEPIQKLEYGTKGVEELHQSGQSISKMGYLEYMSVITIN
ncbi:MAG: hypothetical protein PF489_14065 [Salinivirgaceae bacterium]|jgi:hypothetical protein|nr:hypothetical protein [Salinivirgaceae bacterium]